MPISEWVDLLAASLYSESSSAAAAIAESSAVAGVNSAAAAAAGSSAAAGANTDSAGSSADVNTAGSSVGIKRKRGRPPISNIERDKQRRLAELRESLQVSSGPPVEFAPPEQPPPVDEPPADAAAGSVAIPAGSAAGSGGGDADAQRDAAQQPQLQLAMLGAGAFAIVPFVAHQGTIGLLTEGFSKKALLSTALPATEVGIIRFQGSAISANMMATNLSVSRQTVMRRTRLLGAAVCVFKRVAAERFIRNFFEYLQLRHGGAGAVRPLLWVTKYRYDEMTLRVRQISDANHRHRDTGASLGKILQPTIAWSCVFALPIGYVRVAIDLPPMLRTIERNNARCLRAALSRQVQPPQVAKDLFPAAARASVISADSHSANNLADDSMWYDSVIDTPAKYACAVHKDHKCMELIAQSMPYERSGLCYTVLSLQSGTSFSTFRRSMREQVNTKLKVYPYGMCGAGPEAERYRTHVWELFCSDFMDKEKWRNVRPKQLARYHARWRLLNGNYKRLNVIEHYCRGWPGCCRNAEHTKEQMISLWVDEMERPKLWNIAKWNGFETSVDFCGFLWALHGVYLPAVEDAFGHQHPPPQTESCHDAVHLNPVLAIMDDPTVEAMPIYQEGSMDEMVEPLKDDSRIERCKTYVRNALTWARRCPLARLMILRPVVGAHALGTNAMFGQVGSAWKREEFARRQRGEEPRYRVTEAAKGHYWRPQMREYTVLMMEKDRWNLPREYRRHDTSVQAYRACSLGAASTFHLLAQLFERDNFHFFEVILNPGSIAQHLLGESILEMFHKQPCRLSPWWYDHVQVFQTLELLLSDDSIITITAMAEEIEWENVIVETNNANIRKIVALASQQWGVSMADVSARHALGKEKGFEAECTCLEPFLDEAEEPETVPKMTSGGGGRWRAFVSMHSKEMRKPGSNLLDFKRIVAAYRAEQEKDHSPILERCAELGRHATQAYRDKFRAEASGGAKSGLSSFGAVTSNLRRKHARDDSMQAALLDGEAANGTSVSSAVALLDESIADQMAKLYRACAAHRRDTLAAHRREDDALRKDMAEPAPEFARGEGEGEALGEGRQAAVLHRRSSLPTVVPQLEALKCSAYRIKQVCSKKFTGSSAGRNTKNVAETLQARWEEEHTTMTEQEAPELDEVPASYRPAECWKRNRCVCCGHGEILALCAKRFADVLVPLCPKGSSLRKLLQSSYLLVQISGHCHLLHIALCYLNPRRPVFIKMDDNGNFWGYRAVKPKIRGNGDLILLSDLDAAEEMDLSGPLSFTLLRFVEVDRMFDNWGPAERLIVAPVSEDVLLQNPVRFWDGDEEEIKREQARRAKERARRARDYQRKKHGEARGSAPRNVRRNKRPAQRPPRAVSVFEPPAEELHEEHDADEGDGSPVVAEIEYAPEDLDDEDLLGEELDQEQDPWKAWADEADISCPGVIQDLQDAYWYEAGRHVIEAEEDDGQAGL